MSDITLNKVALFDALQEINGMMSPGSPGKKELNTILKTLVVAIECEEDLRTELEDEFGVMRSWYD